MILQIPVTKVYQVEVEGGHGEAPCAAGPKRRFVHNLSVEDIESNGVLINSMPGEACIVQDDCFDDMPCTD